MTKASKALTLCKDCRQLTECKLGIFDNLCDKCLKEKQKIKEKENHTLYEKHS